MLPPLADRNIGSLSRWQACPVPVSLTTAQAPLFAAEKEAADLRASLATTQERFSHPRIIARRLASLVQVVIARPREFAGVYGHMTDSGFAVGGGRPPLPEVDIAEPQEVPSLEELDGLPAV
jgi:hypothetical protein